MPRNYVQPKMNVRPEDEVRALMLRRETISLLRVLTTSTLYLRDRYLAQGDVDGVEQLNDILRTRILVMEERSADI